MPTSLTELQVINQALRNLGEDPLAAFPETTTKRGVLASEFYPTVRDATLMAHKWTFAIKRTTLYAYTEPLGTVTPGAGATVIDTTGVTFTASVAGTFVASDVGKTIRGDGVTGQATITGFTSGTVVTATITTAFASLAAIPSGSWRLYNAQPAWGFSNAIIKPSDCLAVYRQEDSRLEGAQGRDHQSVPDPDAYQVETDGIQEVILAEADSINVRLLMQVTSPTRWSPLFVRALQHHLSATFAENITGQAGKHDRFWNLYQVTLKIARGRNVLEGTMNIRRSSTLRDVRTEG